LDSIIRQDLRDLTEIKNIVSIETLIEMLRHRVGSPISLNNLAQDLQCHHSTVKRWLDWLEELYVIFKVPPFHRNIARSLLTESKYYFYDTAAVNGTEGAKLENLVAFSLLKQLHLQEDNFGADIGLHYLRTKDGKEVDFLVTLEGKQTLIEIKAADTSLAPALLHFKKYLPTAQMIQLVKNTQRSFTHPSAALVTNLAHWLVEPLKNHSLRV
jgi:predicted AAA+ superfamily ATPase